MWGWVTHFLCYKCFFVTCYANEKSPFKAFEFPPFKGGAGRVF